MILDRFFEHYFVTHEVPYGHLPDSITSRADKKFLTCMELLGGKTFNHGIYRVYAPDQLERVTETVSRLFTTVKDQMIVFASDWSGRQFAIDFTETRNGEPTVECFDLGAPDSFCTDEPIVSFHNTVLVDNSQAALAESFFRQWRKKHPTDISPDDCVGYKNPLFLGGADELPNLELSNMELYLQMCLRLWNTVKDLPSGTRIRDILIEDNVDD